MDAAKLEAFILVAEEASFSAAADRAGTAQSTISSRIKELEAAVGQRLFVRTSRNVRLSPAGEAALPAARTAVTALESVRQAVDEVAGIRRGRVRLGVVTGADVPGLATILADFSDEFPGIELVIVSASSIDLEAAVSSGTLDIALVVRFGPTDLQWEELLSDPLTVIGGPGAQPRTGSRSPDAPVTVAALQSERLIVLDAGAGARTALEAAAQRSGVRLTITAQVSTPTMAEELHARGLGLLVVPSTLTADDGRRIVDEDGAELHVDVGLATHPDVRTPAAELLLTRLVDELAPGARPTSPAAP